MKYVIYKTEQDHSIIYKPVLIPEHVTHSSVKVDDHFGKERKPINHDILHSAGFCWISGGFMVVDQTRKSESLNIGPKKGDDVILNSVLMDCGTNSFIEYL